MDIYRICRTCLNESSSNFVSIYSYLESNHRHSLPNENKTQIIIALDKLTGDKYNFNEFPYPDKICEPCLNNLRVAFDFNQRCANTFEQLIELSENKQFAKDIIEFKSVDEDNPIIENNTSITTQLIDENEFPETKHEIGENEPQIEIEETDYFDHNIDTDETDEDDKPLQRIAESLKCDSKQKVDKNKRRSCNIDKKAADKPLKTKKKSFQCDICNQSFTRHTHLKRHMTIHTDERAYACTQCDKRFRRPDHLKIHENYHAKIRPHICQLCEKTFSRTEHLKRHIRNQHNRKEKKILPCGECEYISSSIKELTKHRRMHNIVAFVCKFCYQEFPTKIELNEHTKCHNDEKPFLCSECGMRFIRNDYLVVHMRRHKGEKPYQCRYCSRGFPRPTDLKIHEKYHTNERTHTCSICGRSFQRAWNLSVHMRTHTGEKPYQCHHCLKRFAQNNDCKAHIRRHTGERYHCDVCSTSFIQHYMLSRHKKDVHGIEIESHIGRVTRVDSNTTQSQSETIESETIESEGETVCVEIITEENSENLVD